MLPTKWVLDHKLLQILFKLSASKTLFSMYEDANF